MAAPASSASTDLAVDRTRLAHDRTLLAWVRTAVSLIGFGFTIYKFFQYLRDQKQIPADRTVGPREFAMIMIGTGIVSLVIATIHHRLEMKRMRTRYPGVPYSMATIVAGLVGFLGLIAFVLVILRQ